MNLKELVIGLELGSTRIKAVVLDKDAAIICSSEHAWENEFIDGVWTYAMENVVNGLQDCFHKLLVSFEAEFGEKLSTCGAMGISGMMHGYLVFDKNGNQLARFRTWRNTMTEEAANRLSEVFHFAIPQRWSIAHIYHSILKGAPEVRDIDYATTLCGYIHYRLTGKRVIGIGEGSGMFPVDEKRKCFNESMMASFDELVKGEVPWKIKDILPHNLVAGEDAGTLTEEGALFLDPTGTFLPGVPLVPPEGDMATGMVATNSCALGTGNASCGTASNVTIITGKYLTPNKCINMIVSPSGYPAALVHVSNGTTDISRWVNLMEDAIRVTGGTISKDELYQKLFLAALHADPDCGGLIHYNTASGEPILGINEGRPLLVRTPNAKMDIGNVMRSAIYSSFCAIRYGLDLLRSEGVTTDRVTGHGGFFKTPVVGATLMSAALNVKAVTLSSAGEGGPYGMALLAHYYLYRKENEPLEEYLENIFAGAKSEEIMAGKEDIEGFDAYYRNYLALLDTEKEAIKGFKIK